MFLAEDEGGGGDDQPDEEELFDEIGQPEGKIGAKKLRKLQDKAERKRQREVCQEIEYWLKLLKLNFN